MYINSGNLALFQYVNDSGGISKKYQTISNTFLTNIKNSSTSFYIKHEIFDIDGNRINFIDHRAIRKSHNYQEYLQGKEEFERQLKKNHKSGDTTKIYYENQNFEWNESKKHKIALVQNLVVGIFKGDIKREEHKTAELFESGPMADCKDNKYPTFDNAKTMRENEYCTDWSKCLTSCDKACVIPKVHGPVIYAWISYMKDARKGFVREQDWEKEYLIDYKSANNTIKYFTDAEKKYCLIERDKYMSFMQMNFSKICKTKENKYA